MTFYHLWGLILVPAVILGGLILGCTSKNKVAKRISLSLICLIGTVIVWLIIMLDLLFSHPDLVWLSFVLGIDAFVICLLFIWKPFGIKAQRLAALGLAAAGVIAVAAAFAPIAYKNSLTEFTDVIDLSAYAPFREGTLAKSLDQPASLRLKGDLPSLDGATALYPLYAAFARAVYPEGGFRDVYGDYDYKYNNRDDPAPTPPPRPEDGPIITCSTTAQAFENLLNGNVDVIFLAGISEEQADMARRRKLELSFTPIGSEAFVFFVNKRNSISGLSMEEIQGIYSGRITNWREVGGRNNAIRAYQREKNSGSQTALENIMGDVPIMEPPWEEGRPSLMGGMYSAVANYKNYRNSLGYSFLYYLTGMMAGDEIKPLAINGVPPNAETIASGQYPFAGNFYAITVVREYETPRAENTRKLIEWILSPQGQSLVEKTGYVPLP